MKPAIFLSAFLVGFLLLCHESEAQKTAVRGKRRKTVKRLRESLNRLWAKVESLSKPVQIHLDGVDYLVDRQGQAEVKKVEDHSTTGRKEGHKTSGGTPDSTRGGAAAAAANGGGGADTHVHLHFNIPYPKADVASTKNNSLPDVYRYARCFMKQRMMGTKHNIYGFVLMRQKPSKSLEVKVNLAGFHVDPRSHPLHGFHIHQYGDLQNGCASFGGHYNPEGMVHGGPTDDIRHVGDWGNLRPNARGVVQVNMVDKKPSLFGADTIIGRGIVIHERADDLGKGGTKASLTTGNAGGRLACCVIASCGPFEW